MNQLKTYYAYNKFHIREILFRKIVLDQNKNDLNINILK
jgi:hypothetical protein